MKKKYYILIGLITCMFMFLPVSSVKAAEENEGVFCAYSNKKGVIRLMYDKTRKETYFCLVEGTAPDGDPFSYCNKQSNIVPFLNASYEEKFKLGEYCPIAIYHFNNDAQGNPLYLLSYGFDSAGMYVFQGVDGANMQSRDKDKEDVYLFSKKGTAGMRDDMDDLNVNDQGASIIESFDIEKAVVKGIGKSKLEDMDCAILATNIKYPTTLKEKATNYAYNTIIEEYNNFVLKTNPDQITKTEEEISDLMDAYIKALKENGDYFGVCGKDEKKLKERLTQKLGPLFDIYIDKDHYEGVYYCGIFGEGTFGVIKSLFGIIKILIPAIIILLGMADFLKVVFSGEEKDMKSAGMRLVKRLIIGIIFILLPVLLGFIFDLVGFSEDCLGQLI